MMFPEWLRKNFLRRGLRKLSQIVEQRLFSSLHLPSLLPRFPLIKPEIEDPDSHLSKTTDLRIEKNGCEVAVYSSDTVRVDSTYAQWAEQFTDVPTGLLAEKVRNTGSVPDGSQGGQQLFFPLDVYVSAFTPQMGLDVELVHRCRATKRIPDGKTLPANEMPEPMLLIIQTHLLK